MYLDSSSSVTNPYMNIHSTHTPLWMSSGVGTCSRASNATKSPSLVLFGPLVFWERGDNKQFLLCDEHQLHGIPPLHLPLRLGKERWEWGERMRCVRAWRREKGRMRERMMWRRRRIPLAFITSNSTFLHFLDDHTFSSHQIYKKEKEKL